MRIRDFSNMILENPAYMFDILAWEVEPKYLDYLIKLAEVKGFDNLDKAEREFLDICINVILSWIEKVFEPRLADAICYDRTGKHLADLTEEEKADETILLQGSRRKNFRFDLLLQFALKKEVFEKLTPAEIHKHLLAIGFKKTEKGKGRKGYIGKDPRSLAKWANDNGFKTGDGKVGRRLSGEKKKLQTVERALKKLQKQNLNFGKFQELLQGTGMQAPYKREDDYYRFMSSRFKLPYQEALAREANPEQALNKSTEEEKKEVETLHREKLREELGKELGTTIKKANLTPDEKIAIEEKFGVKIDKITKH